MLEMYCDQVILYQSRHDSSIMIIKLEAYLELAQSLNPLKA